MLTIISSKPSSIHGKGLFARKIPKNTLFLLKPVDQQLWTHHIHQTLTYFNIL